MDGDFDDIMMHNVSVNDLKLEDFMSMYIT